MARRYTFRSNMTGKIMVSCECESCGNAYNYTEQFPISSSEQVGSRAPDMAKEQKLRQKHGEIMAGKFQKIVTKRQARGDYGCRPCPKCGYIQAFMVGSARRKYGVKVGWIALAVAAVILLIFEIGGYVSATGAGGYGADSLVTALIGAVVILGAVVVLARGLAFRFYDPNRGKAMADAVKQPAIRYEPSPAAKVIQQAMQALQQKNLTKAIKHFDDALRIDPDAAGAYLGRGLAHHDTQNPEQAIRDLRQYVRLSGVTADAQIVGLLRGLETQHTVPQAPAPQAAQKVIVSGDPFDFKPAPTALTLFLGIAGIGVIALLVVGLFILGFDRIVLSVVVAVVGGGLAAAGVDHFLDQPALARENVVKGAGIAFALVAAVLVGGMLVNGEAAAWSHYSDMSSAVEPLCNNASSSGSGSASGGLGKVWVYGPASATELGFPEASSVDEIDTVVCISEKRNRVESCDYTSGATVIRYSYTWTVTAVDYESRTTIAQNQFTGSSPATCPQSIYTERNKTTNYYGGRPTKGTVGAWLESLE